jgi:hypothetical protein
VRQRAIAAPMFVRYVEQMEGVAVGVTTRCCGSAFGVSAAQSFGHPRRGCAPPGESGDASPRPLGQRESLPDILGFLSIAPSELIIHDHGFSRKKARS